jgi:hypothetical protein
MRSDTYTPQDINPPADGCEPDADELDLAESFIQALEYTDDRDGDTFDTTDYRCRDSRQHSFTF